MKTRIVYPQMWLDEKFAACSIPTKLLFCYLINNIQLGLTRYLHINDRQMMFDTGLNANQLKTAKKELANLRWVFFASNWVYHNHKCAYVDFDGNERVKEGKEKELQLVPDTIRQVFKGLITSQPILASDDREDKPLVKGLESSLQEDINPKSETLNPKSEIIIGVVKGKEVKDNLVLEEKKYAKLEDLTQEDFEYIRKKYNVPIAFVLAKYDAMVNWAAQPRNKNKVKGRDWHRTLMDWVREDATKIAMQQRNRRGGVADARGIV